MSNLAELLSDVGREPDPAVRFERLRVLREDRRTENIEYDQHLRRAQTAAVVELRDSGATWREIGERLGVSAQRAEQLSRA